MPKNVNHDKWRSHVYRMRFKHGGWHNRRFGKNPRWSNPECDAYRESKRQRAQQREKKG